MATVPAYADWTPDRLGRRIDEGEALLGEVEPGSGWRPIIVRRLRALRRWQAASQPQPRAA